MDIADKDKLSKLLGMLGSSFDGERANAARMIEAMAIKYKVSINELAALAYSGPVKAQAKEPPWDKPKEKTRAEERPKAGGAFPDDALADLEACIESQALTEWERQFATDIVARYQHDYELSPKQLAVIERITAKVARARQWGRS